MSPILLINRVGVTKKMSKKLFIFISMFLMLAAFACQHDDTAAVDNIKVSATVPMISEWANKVSGTRITVDSIIPHSTNPHGYQPGAKDVAKFSESDLILAIGLVYEEAWLDKLIDSHSDIKLISLPVLEPSNNFPTGSRVL